jgi:PAS domain-containing protein
MQSNWATELFLVSIALVAAALAIAAIVFMERRSKRRPVTVFAEDTVSTVFLFDGETLIDTTPSARALLATSAVPGTAWAKLSAYLAPHFPNLDADLARLPVEGALTMSSTLNPDSPLFLQADLRGGLTRVVLVDPSQHDASTGQDLLAQRAMHQELDQLRDTVARAPFLMWRERANGDIIWANAAYMLRATEVLGLGQDLTWPLPRLFERQATAQNVTGQRQKLMPRQGKPAWYDLTGFADGEDRLTFASLADQAVHAETTLRDFMMTLTKTFAHLHVGLAIFDKDRQLILFNPALLDLTGLPAEFLAMRPSLLSVLDGMRDRNMIPEPKDYRSWRRQMTEMERAAASGLYEETWSLPGGQTYRVIGRPHPNGAVALMIEDISGEMLRTRRYRADLELSQAAMDEVEEAFAVFSSAGHLVISNAAYARLWQAPPDMALADETLRTVCAQWRAQCAPSAIWGDLEDFASNTDDRAAWLAELRLLDGRLIDCRFSPLSGGATMAAFRLRDTQGGPKAVTNPDTLRKRA